MTLTSSNPTFRTTSSVGTETGASETARDLCDNGRLDGAEVCDPNIEAGTIQCMLIGNYIDGMAICTSACAYDESDCVPELTSTDTGGGTSTGANEPESSDTGSNLAECNDLREGMVCIPGGTFKGETRGAFLLERREVTVAQYQECIDAGVCSAEGLPSYAEDALGHYCNYGAPGRLDHPINIVI